MVTDDSAILKHDAEAQRFSMDVEGFTAIIDYRKKTDTTWVLTHTKVPSKLGGRGIGTSLVQKVLDYLDERHVTVVPQCPFIAAFIEKRPEYQHMVAPA